MLLSSLLSSYFVFLVSDHFNIVFMNNPNILVGLVPQSMVTLEILDDMIINEDRTLSLTLSFNLGTLPVNIIINETVVIIEDNDGPSKFKFIAEQEARQIIFGKIIGGGGGGGGGSPPPFLHL